MLTFRPESAPQELSHNVRGWLDRQFKNVRSAANAAYDYLYLKTQHAAPSRSNTGEIRLADGSDWNPGNGAGVYYYDGSSWVRLFTNAEMTANIATFLANPTSANFRAAVSNESGTGALLFAGGDIGAATGTSLAVTGALTSSGGGIGYVTGAGGTATQSGSGKASNVTINKPCGTITMTNQALASQTTVSFTLTNSFIAADDIVVVQHSSVGTMGAYTVCATPASGSALISVRNITGGSLAEAIVLRFAVIKGVTS